MEQFAQYSDPSFLASLPKQDGKLLVVDEKVFLESFDRRPFLVGHNLSRHPLFELSRLMKLANALPPRFVEYNAGELPVNQDPKLTPMNGLSIEETLRRIEECKSWMVLKYVDRDPEYAALLEKTLSEIRPLSERIDPGMCQLEAFIFISSPGSVTPFHIDPEHNFLLQIRGKKTMSIFDRGDKEIMPDDAWQKYYSEGMRNQVYREDFQRKAAVFHLVPGLGVHVPVVDPHWVKNGDEVSVSFSITFRTPQTKRRMISSRGKARLRKFGIELKPYKENRTQDEAVYQVFRVLFAIERSAPYQFARRCVRFAMKRLFGVQPKD